ncbi:MAG: helicase-exonuclease AddAB subunit AddA [Ruminococcus sp.]|nr:helicase-exonuclease AddAB subunit AddA [Ruminococcus sp.]
MAWTKEQEAAISARGSSVLVSAAAGSGKTSVLVERLIRQLSDSTEKIPADRMAIVTFTKDAAAEMKQRLTAALAELIEKQPDNHWLNSQQLLLQSAKIATIHSFCFELIRDNVHELELSGSFRIMDESEARLMLTTAISELVTEYYEKHPEQINRLYGQFCHIDDDTIEKLIYDIYIYISSIPYGERWLRECCEKYSPERDAHTEMCDIYSRVIMSSLEKAEEMSAECVSLATDSDIGEKCTDILDTEYFSVMKIKSLFESSSKTLPEKIEEYNAPEFARLTFPKDADPDVKEKITALRNGYKEILRDDIKKSAELIEHSAEDIAVHFEVLVILEQMISELEAKLWKKKTEKNCIGFSDAETLAIKLLSEIDKDGNIKKSSLACELSDYYKIIMIDEFQDTNNNQDLIFKLLSHGGTPERFGDNVFMVGDVKQSIYRFRLANPKNFINTMENSVEYQEARSGENMYIRLNRNFRSSKDVISFVNFIFSGIMSRKVGDIVYDSGEELVQGASFTDRERKTEIALLVSDRDDKTTAAAEYTAEKISSMLREKVQVDNKDGISTRDCRRRDFCILLRKKDDAAMYISELSKRGISAYSEETAGYLSSREISVLLNLLRIIDNPLIDTSFAAVLMSSMFMLTDDEMTLLRLENRNKYIYNSVCSIAEGNHSENISDVMKAKIINVYDTLRDLRMLSATMSLVELIRKLYDRTDFISVVRLYEDGDRKRANLRALLEYAKIYQESSDDGLGGFLRYIDRTVKMSGDFKQGQTVSTSEDVVMIKTIHKSKGLEFPFVFLCETQTEFNRQDSLKNIRLNFENGIGFRLQSRREFKRYKTLPFEIIDMINNRDSLSEEMRLLYVALTRAKERLFIPLKIGKSQKDKLAGYASGIYQSGGITDEIAASAKSMGDWLIMSLMTHPDGKILRELSGYNMFHAEKSDFNILFYEFSPESEDGTENADQDNTKKAEPDEELTQKIKTTFEKSYDSSLSSVRAKLSVSDISKDHEKFGIILKKPSFMNEKSKMTGSERGTVIHSILQHADFEKLFLDTEKEILSVADRGFITVKQAEAIDPMYIKSFISSDIFKRASASLRIEKERQFLMRISDLELGFDELSEFSGTDSMIQGIIDMYFEEDDGIVLVDYKTDNVSDVSVLAENYSMQVAIYKAALEKIENKKVKQALIYSLKLGETIEV